MASQHDPSSFPLQPDPYDLIFAPLEAEMLAWLALPAGARVLDAGCGPGTMVARFAAAVGDGGHVDGLDANGEVVEQARRYVAGQPHAERAELQTGDLMQLPFEDGSFDLAWCSFVIHHMPDPVAAARELRRVVRPGGRVVLRETGTPLRMLPFDIGIGEPGLQDRLRVTHNRYFAAHRYAEPPATLYPFGWTQVLRDAGCRDVTARTFWLELLPPFTPTQQNFLVQSLSAYIADPSRGIALDPSDAATLAQLVDPASPHYLLARPDLHVLAGLSLYVGTVSAEGAPGDAEHAS